MYLNLKVQKCGIYLYLQLLKYAGRHIETPTEYLIFFYIPYLYLLKSENSDY